MPGLCSTRVLLGPLALARAKGVEGETFAAGGIDPRTCDDLSAWVPVAAARKVFEHLERITGDAAIGLHCAEVVPPEAYDYLHFIGASSANIGEAAHLFEELFGQLGSDAKATLHTAGRRARLGIRVAIEEPGPRAVEYVVACTLRAFQGICVEPLEPLNVEWRHAAPLDTRAFDAFFGCPSHFGQAQDALVFDEAVLGYRTVQPDAKLKGAMLRYAEVVNQKQPKTRRVTDQLEQWVLQRLSKGALTIPAAGKSLGMSSRTLQRRLEEEGTQFRALVDQVRERLARSYLRRPEMGVGEIAGLLGYTDARSFHRAFVGWMGMTPGRFRKGTEPDDAGGSRTRQRS